MNILNRSLSLVQNTGTQTVSCVAGCRVELNAFETFSLLDPNFPGFRLRCVLLGNDPGSNSDDTIVTYNRSKTFNKIEQILNMNQVFEEVVSTDVLDEDASGPDEIVAEFTLVNLSNGQFVQRRSNQVNRDF